MIEILSLCFFDVVSSEELMTEFTLQLGTTLPLYEQIYRYVVDEIRTGRMRAGEALPSKRRLCSHLGVSMSTVETAYGMLVAEGYLESRPRSGYRVCTVRPLEPAPPPSPVPPAALFPASHVPVLSDCFSTSAVDTEAFPYASWARLSREAISRNAGLLQRGPGQGDLELRETLCRFLHQYRGVSCVPEQIIIGAGLEYLISLLLQLLPASTVLGLEDPGYHAIYRTADNLRLRSVPIPVDSQGMSADALARSPATVAYVTPSHQFPLGVTMPVGRRMELLHWAAAAPERYLIEDDYDSEFRYTTRPIPAMQGLDSGGKVVYVGTFSRSVAPSIRIAYLILPPILLDCYCRRFVHTSSTVSRFEQYTLRAFIDRGLYTRHLRRVGNLYRARCSLLTSALADLPGAQITGNNAGLHFLLWLEGREESAVCSSAAQAGFAIHGLSEYCHQVHPVCGGLVLGFAGMSASEIPERAADLRTAILRVSRL